MNKEIRITIEGPSGCGKMMIGDEPRTAILSILQVPQL